MVFIYGLIGMMLVSIGMCYFMIYDWLMNIGGKLNDMYMDNVLVFILIMFEFIVFCVVYGMVIIYLFCNKIFLGMFV